MVSGLKHQNTLESNGRRTIEEVEEWKGRGEEVGDETKGEGLLWSD